MHRVGMFLGFGIRNMHRVGASLCFGDTIVDGVVNRLGARLGNHYRVG